MSDSDKTYMPGDTYVPLVISVNKHEITWFVFISLLGKVSGHVMRDSLLTINIHRQPVTGQLIANGAFRSRGGEAHLSRVVVDTIRRWTWLYIYSIGGIHVTGNRMGDPSIHLNTGSNWIPGVFCFSIALFFCSMISVDRRHTAPRKD